MVLTDAKRQETALFQPKDGAMGSADFCGAKGNESITIEMAAESTRTHRFDGLERGSGRSIPHCRLKPTTTSST